MGRKKEIVEVNGLAVEAPGVEDAFMEDRAQEEEFDGREEGTDPEMESGGEEPGDMADDTIPGKILWQILWKRKMPWWNPQKMGRKCLKEGRWRNPGSIRMRTERISVKTGKLERRP